MSQAPIRKDLQTLEALRPELHGFAVRIVLRPEIAEEIVQQAALNLLLNLPVEVDSGTTRVWLFKAVSHLAIDHLRRHSTWREGLMDEVRERAEADPEFMVEVTAMKGSPEINAIGREHLVICLACTMRNLPGSHAVALLLVEVYGFTVHETATMLETGFAQVKNWIQHSRAKLQATYESRCALINKRGMCHECAELAQFYHDRPDDPLQGTTRDLDARLRLMRQQRAEPLDRWHQLVLRMAHDLID